MVADALARFHRLLGEEVRFQTGTDEHGDKVMEAAAAAGLPVKEFVDQISGRFRQILGRPGHQLRQLHPHHRPGPYPGGAGGLGRVHASGDIYFGEYGGLYCFGCECFYLERDLVDGLCPDHKTAPTYLKEENYFFRMSKYQDWLIDYIQHPPRLDPAGALQKRNAGLSARSPWRTCASPGPRAAWIGASPCPSTTATSPTSGSTP